MPWFNMHYQVIWPSKCLVNNTKNVWLAYVDGHNVTPPNFGFMKKLVIENRKIGSCIDATLDWNGRKWFAK